MSDENDFVGWATDPARTNDELFTVELLIERTRVRAEWPFQDRRLAFDESLAAMKARRLNPAYRPALLRDEIEAMPQLAARVTHFNGGGGYDRTVRNVEALRFFPALEDIHISSAEVADFSPLSRLVQMRRLTLMETGLLAGCHPVDLAQLGAMPRLEFLYLSLRYPWPDLRAISTFPALSELHFNGNILALAGVETLPEVKFADVSVWPGDRVPVRDLHALPSMPKLKRFTLKSAVSLAGIERYPAIVNLELAGEFRDLTPLSAMSNVTALTLTGEFFTDLAPLARMPKLRELHFISERPLDLSPLTEAPTLRRVEFSRCAIIWTELSALNAGMLPEGLDFLADEPRTLGTLRFFLVTKENTAAHEFFRKRREEIRKARDAFYQDDRAFETAETRSFYATMQTKLDQLLGRGWGLVGKLHGWRPAGALQLSFKRFADTSRIREIIQLLRETSAAARFPWEYLLNVEPHGDMTDELEDMKRFEAEAKEPAGYWAAKYYEPESTLQENAEQLQMRRETYDYLEREHLLRLREQQGGPLDPELFHPAPEEEPEPDAPEFEEEPNSPESADDDHGGVMLAPPPPPPPGTSDLSDELQYYVTLHEDCLEVGSMWAARARYNLGEAPVEWTESA